MAYRYIPILRTKAGEVDAICQLSAAAQAKVFPVINVTGTIPPTFATKMLTNAKGKKIALDGTFSFSSTGSAKMFTALFNALGKGGVLPIPSVSIDSDPNYLAAAKALVNKFDAGLVMQVPIGNLSAMKSWVAAQGWNPAEVDLIFCLEVSPTMILLRSRNMLNIH